MLVPISSTRGRWISRPSSRPNSGSTPSTRTRQMSSKAHRPTWIKFWRERLDRPRDRARKMCLTVPRRVIVAGVPSRALTLNPSAQPQRNLADTQSSPPLQRVSSMILLPRVHRELHLLHREYYQTLHPAQATQQARSIHRPRCRHLDAPQCPPNCHWTTSRTSLSLSSPSKSPARWRSATMTTPRHMRPLKPRDQRDFIRPIFTPTQVTQPKVYTGSNAGARYVINVKGAGRVALETRVNLAGAVALSG
jgi:hypothetical protein